MTKRLNKCTEHEIKTILDTESNSSYDNIMTTTPRNKRISKVQNIVKDFAGLSSDTENVLQSYNNALEKTNNLQNEKTSLRIKLRRSIEQSLYKIDSDSEYEKSIHKSQKRFYRQKKKSYSEMENEECCTESKNNFTTAKSNNSEKQIKNGLLRSNRTWRPPLRPSFYHCDTLNFSNSAPIINSPSLRSKEGINYNEGKLLVNSIISNLENRKKPEKQPHNETSNSSTSKNNSGVNPVHLNINNNKRNHIPPTKDEENDCDTDSAILKAKSLKKSKSRNDGLDHSSKIQKITQKQDSAISVPINNTPVKSNKQKRMNCETTQENIHYVNGNNRNSEDEYLIDIYKWIKIPSPIKKCTPTRSNKQKRIISKNTQTGIQFDNKKNSDTENEFLSDKCKSVKVSTPKKTPRIKNNVERNIVSRLEKTHLSIPKSHKIKIKHSNLTPSLVKRNNALLKPTTPLQEAKFRLHVSAVPKSLPCREEEFNNIFTFLRGKLEDKSGGYVEKII